MSQHRHRLSLHVEWQQDYHARHRRLRVWNLATPWSTPIDYAVPDENVEHLTLAMGPGDMMPGYYLAELYTEDPWLKSSAVIAARPSRTLDNTAVFSAGEDLIDGQLATLPASGRGCVEAFLLDFERGKRNHKYLFPLRESLQEEELEEFIWGLLLLSQDDRAREPEIGIAIEQYFAAALTDRLGEVFRMLPQRVSALPAVHHRQVISWLLRMRLTIDPVQRMQRSVERTGLDASERELLWELWAPLGLITDVRCPFEGRAERLTRYLGPAWREMNGNAELPHWGSCPGPEVNMELGQLKSVWHHLGITPTGPFDETSIQKCNFHMSLGLLERGLQAAACDWVERDCALLENELQQLQQQGRLLPATRHTLLKRHPQSTRGDMKNPLTRLPFVVGAVAVIQRLCADQGKNPNYQMRHLLEQTLNCYEFAPELFARDLCQAEIALTKINEVENADEAPAA